MEEINYWIWLSRIRKLGSVKTQKILEIYHHPKEIWKLKKEDLIKIEGVGEKIADEILNQKYRVNLDKIREKMEKEHIELITLYDKDYPQKLHELYDKPISLYVKGNKNLLNEFSLAMIGCRENSEYGKIIAQAIAKGLAKKGIITISGLAKGIDSISHISTLMARRKNN